MFKVQVLYGLIINSFITSGQNIHLSLLHHDNYEKHVLTATRFYATVHLCSLLLSYSTAQYMQLTK